MRIFTSPWQEADLSCSLCAKGTKNYSEKLRELNGDKRVLEPLVFYPFKVVEFCFVVVKGEGEVHT